MAHIGTSIRLEQETLDRADELASRLGGIQEVSAIGQVTRSTVLRLALLRGLADMESEFAKKGRRRMRQQRRSR